MFLPELNDCRFSPHVLDSFNSLLNECDEMFKRSFLRAFDDPCSILCPLRVHVKPEAVKYALHCSSVDDLSGVAQM